MEQISEKWAGMEIAHLKVGFILHFRKNGIFWGKSDFVPDVNSISFFVPDKKYDMSSRSR